FKNKIPPPVLLGRGLNEPSVVLFLAYLGLLPALISLQAPQSFLFPFPFTFRPLLIDIPAVHTL
ncbi:MAG: hypothetical protein OQK52_11715, partial [Ignavibacteriaceae bacterium]|nr:hypothetical protein [Ignavibacteriaceae bacterium]